MLVEDTFAGAMDGVTVQYVYIAVDAHTSATRGAAQGKMIKEQVGINTFDARAASRVLLAIGEDGFGALSQVIEEGPHRVVVRVGRCPLYESAQAEGMSPEAIETCCRACCITFMDAIAKQLNPNLSYQLVKFRSAADDYCEEAVVLA